MKRKCNCMILTVDLVDNYSQDVNQHTINGKLELLSHGCMPPRISQVAFNFHVCPDSYM